MKQDAAVPRALIEQFAKDVPGFRELSPGKQWKLASMAWGAHDRQRRHEHFEGHATFSHKELYPFFGRGRNGFEAINKAVGFFDVTPNWYSEEGLTKGYKLSDPVLRSMLHFLERAFRKPTDLLYTEGKDSLKVIRKPPVGVEFRGVQPDSAAAMRSAMETLCRPRVDVKMLAAARAQLKRWRLQLIEGIRPDNHHLTRAHIPVLERLEEQIGKVIRMSWTSMGNEQMLPHRYIQATTGRWFATGISLQSAPGIIKDAALHGLWEFDFSNCHFTILDQMAQQFGYECSGIRHYLNHKNDVRQAIAGEVGITIDQAKKCVLAALYGAPVNATPFRQGGRMVNGAILEEIGAEATKRLKAHQLFAAIHADIKGARRQILKSHPTERGRYVNACRKAIEAKAKPEQILSHLIQGVEAQALMTVLHHYPYNVVLLQHDGWVSNAPMTPPTLKALSEQIHDATGYWLSIEVDALHYNPDKYFEARP